MLKRRESHEMPERSMELRSMSEEYMLRDREDREKHHEHGVPLW